MARGRGAVGNQQVTPFLVHDHLIETRKTSLAFNGLFLCLGLWPSSRVPLDLRGSSAGLQPPDPSDGQRKSAGLIGPSTALFHEATAAGALAAPLQQRGNLG